VHEVRLVPPAYVRRYHTKRTQGCGGAR
jgi:hypothetical protein